MGTDVYCNVEMDSQTVHYMSIMVAFGFFHETLRCIECMKVQSRALCEW